MSHKKTENKTNSHYYKSLLLTVIPFIGLVSNINNATLRLCLALVIVIVIVAIQHHLS